MAFCKITVDYLRAICYTVCYITARTVALRTQALVRLYWRRYPKRFIMAKQQITHVLNMTVLDDSDFLSPYSETDTPVISQDVADFLENGANAAHPKDRLELNVTAQRRSVFDFCAYRHCGLGIYDNLRAVVKVVVNMDRSAGYICLGIYLGSGRPIFYRAPQNFVRT